MVRRLKRTFTIENIPDAINCSLTKEFTQIPNELLRNPKISGKAKALLCLLLSNKEGWKSYITAIKRMMKEGEDAIRSGISELEEHGYLLRIKYRDKKTKVWRGSFWAYTDLPWKLNIESQKQIIEQSGFEIPEIQLERIKKPDTGNPDPENPDMENPGLIILRDNNLKVNKTNLSLKDKSFKSKLDDSSNQKKTSSYDNPEDYSNEVQSLFSYWQNLGIRKHKPSKTRDHALQQLNIYIHRYSIEDITESMDRYKQLLNDGFSILSDESPYKVGLDEFFGFNRHTKTRIKNTYIKLKGIKSWFEECRKEDLSHLMRVGKNPYPLIAQALKKGFKERIGPVSDSTHHENLFRKASRLLMEFHLLNKDKLTIQLQNKPGIFAKCFIEYLESSKSKNGKHPGWLCTDVTWEVFPVWLSEKGYTSEENDTLSDYR